MGTEELLALTSRLGPDVAALAEDAWSVSRQLLKDAQTPAGRSAVKASAKIVGSDMSLARAVATSTFQNWDHPSIFENLRLSEAEQNTPSFKILDVGAGSQNLAKAVAARGWVSQIYSVEPRLGITQTIENDFAEYPKDLSILRESHPLAISALAHELPFASGTFDRVVGHFSVPHYLKEPAQIKASLAEMMRVLKPDGVGKFFPLTPRHTDPSLLSALGRRYELQYVSLVASSAEPAGAPGWRLITEPLGR